MLRALSIRDYVIVDRLDLELGAGFTALTGETGAGKSILVDALALAIGANQCAVVSLFTLWITAWLRDVAGYDSAAAAAGPSRPMDNTDFSFLWRKEMTKNFVSLALHDLRD
jgi:predicted ATPase